MRALLERDLAARTRTPLASPAVSAAATPYAGRLAPVAALLAPARLAMDTRVAFRRAALDLVERAQRDRLPSVLLDLGATTEIDQSGLGLLVLVRKRAEERGMPTVLWRVRPPVRRLLSESGLESLFVFRE